MLGAVRTAHAAGTLHTVYKAGIHGTYSTAWNGSNHWKGSRENRFVDEGIAHLHHDALLARRPPHPSPGVPARGPGPAQTSWCLHLG
jgi:hypothetical protein